MHNSFVLLCSFLELRTVTKGRMKVESLWLWCHPPTKTYLHLLCVSRPLQSRSGLHKGSGVFSLTVTLACFWPWLWHPRRRSPDAYPLPTSLAPAADARWLRPLRGSPCRWVPVQARAAQADCTGHTSLSAKQSNSTQNDINVSESGANPRPLRSFHLLEQTISWQTGKGQKMWAVTLLASDLFLIP